MLHCKATQFTVGVPGGPQLRGLTYTVTVPLVLGLACCLTPPGNRYHHNLAHVMSMFDFIKRAAKAGLAITDAAAVDWAVWFHDIIHDPTSSSNEAESAELAGKLLLAAGEAWLQVVGCGCMLNCINQSLF